MMKIKKSHYILGLLTVIVLAGIYWGYSASKAPGKYDDFAKCLTEKNAEFYGAWWCPACAQQKKLFGNSMKYVNYIECSTPDRSSQTSICINEKITGYPTWKFNDGTKVSGVLGLDELAQRSECILMKN
ncbi:hypothetical protein HYX16_04100 [Candidatus Woesearchaeota archaeon]|nr:hypothetical protein [Candidatus Woesearchaeota archaeon]